METLTGFVATGSGRTTLELVLEATTARLRMTTRWMGQEPLDVTLVLRHHATGLYSGALFVERAVDAAGAPLHMPPSDGELAIEYARLGAPQSAPVAGNESMAAVGSWTDPWSVLVWLHADSFYDKGTDLPPEEYEVPPAQFAAVARILGELERPWKLG